MWDVLGGHITFHPGLLIGNRIDGLREAYDETALREAREEMLVGHLSCLLGLLKPVDLVLQVSF